MNLFQFFIIQNGKMKTKWESQFFSTLDAESNGGIFDSLAPFDGELWRFENLKFVQHLQPTQNFFWEIFLSQ